MRERDMSPEPASADTNLVLVGTDPAHWRGRYVEFQPAPRVGRKTMLWDVIGSDGVKIAEIKWFTHWRRYCFFPTAAAVFEEVCLADIAQFLRDRTKEHRHGA